MALVFPRLLCADHNPRITSKGTIPMHNLVLPTLLDLINNQEAYPLYGGVFDTHAPTNVIPNSSDYKSQPPELRKTCWQPFPISKIRGFNIPVMSSRRI